MKLELVFHSSHQIYNSTQLAKLLFSYGFIPLCLFHIPIPIFNATRADEEKKPTARLYRTDCFRTGV